MNRTEFRVESNHPISGQTLPLSDCRQYFFGDRAPAIAMVAKSISSPSRQEIRVIYVPTGEVVFRKFGSTGPESSDEL